MHGAERRAGLLLRPLQAPLSPGAAPCARPSWRRSRSGRRAWIPAGTAGPRGSARACGRSARPRPRSRCRPPCSATAFACSACSRCTPVCSSRSACLASNTPALCARPCDNVVPACLAGTGVEACRTPMPDTTQCCGIAACGLAASEAAARLRRGGAGARRSWTRCAPSLAWAAPSCRQRGPSGSRTSRSQASWATALPGAPTPRTAPVSCEG